MQKKETAIEVKVGALVLFSTALLVAFVLVLGDFSFSDGYTFHVDFDNAGGLKPGADVAIAGLQVGNVQRLEFIKGGEKKASKDMNIVAVRATLVVSDEFAESVRKNSKFYVTTRGVLGEPYIEVVTETFDQPRVKRGEILRGVDPPRIDIIVTKAERLLTVLTDLLSSPEIATKELIQRATRLLKTLSMILDGNRAHIDGAIVGAKDFTQKGAKLLDTLNFAMDDKNEIKGMVKDLRVASRDLRTTARDARVIARKVNRNIDPILSDVKGTATDARAMAKDARALLDRNAPRIDRTMKNVEAASGDLKDISKDTKVIVRKLKRGDGTVGKLMTDREMYDDLKEILRQIKRKPWKIIWKE